MNRSIPIVVGLILAVAGGLSLALGGIPYQEQEEIINVGPVEASAEVEKRLDIPPLVGGLILAAGVGLTVYGAKARG